MKINQMAKLPIILSLLTTGSIHSTSSELKPNGTHTTSTTSSLLNIDNHNPKFNKKEKALLDISEAINDKWQIIKNERDKILAADYKECATDLKVLYEKFVIPYCDLIVRLKEFVTLFEEFTMPNKVAVILNKNKAIFDKVEILINKRQIIRNEMDKITAADNKEHATDLKVLFKEHLPSHSEFIILVEEHIALYEEFKTLNAKITPSLFRRLITTVGNFFCCKKSLKIC